MLVSLTAALIAALCYGIASVMQAIAVREASNRPHADAAGGGVDPGLVPRMLRQWRFVASLLLDTLGFIAQLVALQRLPLFAVQAIVAANLAVTALIVAVAALGVCGLAAARFREPMRTLLLGTVAGFGYGLIGIAARVLNGFEPLTLLRDPAAYAVAAAGIVSFVFYATALESGSVTVATAAVVLAETLPPAIIGVMFLGDRTRPGLEPAAIAGFLLAVASA